MRRLITLAVTLGVLSSVFLMASPAKADVHHQDQYANGCSVPGNPGWRDNPSGVANVHSACDQHDLCYVFHAAGSSEAGRKACDDMFYQLMKQNVFQQVPWWQGSRRAHGLYWASIYYFGVRGGGSQPFWQNQVSSRSNVLVHPGF